jgi:IS30 family transposase
MRRNFAVTIREIAKLLERAASTVSREVARHGGRPARHSSAADSLTCLSHAT